MGKADSDLSEPEGSGEDEDSNPKPSKRGRKSKGGAIEEANPSKEESPEAQAMPTVLQVCEQWGLNDVDLEYSDADYSNLTTYKLFQQTFRPRIQAENPKVPMSKLMMLVAAKWREFTSLGPAEEEEVKRKMLKKLRLTRRIRSRRKLQRRRKMMTKRKFLWQRGAGNPVAVEAIVNPKRLKRMSSSTTTKTRAMMVKRSADVLVAESLLLLRKVRERLFRN